MVWQLLQTGDFVAFAMLLVALILSLSLHEFGHAWAAKLYGDDTAQRLGRLTINPIKHIDPMGLLMVIMVGVGYAKPVPFNPNNFSSVWGRAGVAIAGPIANLLIAFVALNFYVFGLNAGWGFLDNDSSQQFFRILIYINLLLMLFNMIPLGVLDGHHILPYFLPKKLAEQYRSLNAQYGMYALIGLLLLSILGLPVLSFIHAASDWFIKILLIV